MQMQKLFNDSAAAQIASNPKQNAILKIRAE